jgi:DNA replication protein DnaC
MTTTLPEILDTGLHIDYDRWCQFTTCRMKSAFDEKWRTLFSERGVAKWETLEDRPNLHEDDHMRVGKREKVCPLCNDHNEVPVPAKGVRADGSDTGLRATYYLQCLCGFYKRFCMKLYNQELIPKHYRWISLPDLKPDPICKLPLDQQATVLEIVQNIPFQNYFLHGPAGVGKTTISTALYIHAIEDWAWESFRGGVPTESVWRTTANALCEQYQRSMDFNSDEVPLVTQGKISAAQKAGLVPRLFIEEIDKIGTTKTRLNTLFTVINMIYEADGQLVTTSNLSDSGLIDYFGKEHGGPIVRRFCEPGRGMVVNLTPKKSTPNQI